jgi:hypothetical protein
MPALAALQADILEDIAYWRKMQRRLSRKRPRRRPGLALVVALAVLFGLASVIVSVIQKEQSSHSDDLQWQRQRWKNIGGPAPSPSVGTEPGKSRTTDPPE